MKGSPLKRRVLHAGAATIAAVVLALTGLGIARATDSPGFCSAACHEMSPYRDAWARGSHRGVSCVECHVAPGTAARLTHKLRASKEVWAHFTTSPKFPSGGVDVADARCVGCHRRIPNRTPGFDHSAHAARGSCTSCHPDVGHRVTAAALRNAGILANDTTRTGDARQVASPGRGAANLTGHVGVACSQCHDMAKTACAGCHAARHAGSGPASKTAGCGTCHRPGAKFTFIHPAPTTAGAPCATCHKPPAKHTFRGACSVCHDKIGVSWAFEHRVQGDCSTCHSRPAGHAAGACGTCHRVARSWAFTHPTSRTCGSCHARPAGHKSGACTTCHAAGSWRFRHPASRSCGSCHARPAGHRSGSCTTCHSAGSWRFRHTSSSSCASCHSAPARHFGGACARCHRVGRSWSSARFSHPGIPGGEHSYRSFGCSSCHPGGYSSYSCRSCHDSNRPGDGGGDD